MLISSSPWKILSQCECSIFYYAHLIQPKFIAQLYFQTQQGIHFVQIMSICTSYVLNLVNNLVKEVGPNYLQVSHFNHLFPQMASSKVSSCEAIWGRRWFLGKRFELEIVNSYSWLLTSLIVKKFLANFLYMLRCSTQWSSF